MNFRLNMKYNRISQLFLYLLFPLMLTGQTTLEEIIDDMTEPHEGRPHGVPVSWDWAAGPRYGAESPPDGWDAAIAWGQLYEWIEGNPTINTRVQIRDLEMHYLSNSDLLWHELQESWLAGKLCYCDHKTTECINVLIGLC